MISDIINLIWAAAKFLLNYLRNKDLSIETVSFCQPETKEDREKYFLKKYFPQMYNMSYKKNSNHHYTKIYCLLYCLLNGFRDFFRSSCLFLIQFYSNFPVRPGHKNHL